MTLSNIKAGDRIRVHPNYLLFGGSTNMPKEQKLDIANGLSQVVTRNLYGEIRIYHSNMAKELQNGWWIPDRFIMTAKRTVIIYAEQI